MTIHVDCDPIILNRTEPSDEVLGAKNYFLDLFEEYFADNEYLSIDNGEISTITEFPAFLHIDEIREAFEVLRSAHIDLLKMEQPVEVLKDTYYLSIQGRSHKSGSVSRLHVDPVDLCLMRFTGEGTHSTEVCVGSFDIPPVIVDDQVVDSDISKIFLWQHIGSHLRRMTDADFDNVEKVLVGDFSPFIVRALKDVHRLKHTPETSLETRIIGTVQVKLK